MEMAVIYGAITLHEDYIRSIEFIKSLEKDVMFPSINTSDFGLGAYNDYHHEGVLMYNYSWDNMIISYSNTCGAAIFDMGYLELFILKMEHILRNIDFAKAILHIESVESLENADLFWEKKRNRNHKQERLEKEQIAETGEWYFGYGKRSLAGYLVEPVEHIWHSFKDHLYPAKFSEGFARLFFDTIQGLLQQYGTKGIPRPELEKELILDPWELRKIISYLSFKKVIDVEAEYGVEVVQVIKPDMLKIELLYS
jgi:hypothetical protein